MANHVATRFSFDSISEAGVAKVKELFSRVRQEEGSYRHWVGDMWVDGEQGSPSYEDSETYDWTVENVGSKWCYFDEGRLEDLDIASDTINMVSAWSVPFSAIAWFVEQIAEVDPSVVLRVSYEDEMPNFIGVALYNRDGLYQEEEWDYEEIKEGLHNEYPEMVEHWDSEEEEGDEEYNDMFFENIWEYVNQLQMDTIESFVEDLENESN